eukprot:scaffold4060_cov190-Amphora_coffeaeformis.AAC.13
MQERAATSWRRRRNRQSSSFHNHDDDPCSPHCHNNTSGNDTSSLRLLVDNVIPPPTLIPPSSSTTTTTTPSEWKGHVRTVPRRHKRRDGCNVLLGVTTALAVLVTTWQVGWFLPHHNNNSRTLRRTASVSSHHQHYSPDDVAGIPLSQVPYATFPYYSPPVLTRPQVSLEDFFVHDDNPNTDYNSQQQPVLHFVHSRFMQEQGNLTALAWARLHLLEIVCWPTLVAQTTTNFLWLLRVDPDLDASVAARLRDLLQPYPHFYLVASNHNFRINEDFPGAWRDGAQATDLRASRIYTGDPTRLAQALTVVDDVLILDTRLDADDGLHVDYLRAVQRAARDEFLHPNNDAPTDDGPTLKWKYWCARRHLAWHWALPQLHNNNNSSSSSSSTTNAAGYLTGTQTSHMCITPGFTVAFPVGVREADVPVYAHHELIYKLQQLPPEQSCMHTSTGTGTATTVNNHDTENCFAFVSTHAFEAIRSRTPTSAGMLAVADDPERPDNADHSAWLEYAFWDVLWDDFGLSRAQLVWMQSYLTHHLRQIGQDNLQGQCTTGHSCKLSAKRDLERLVALAAAASNGN